eukprot:superscaffoldBa00001627_g11355
MGHQNTEMDIESLQKSDRRRGGWLDLFLVVSIIFLFVAVTAVAVGGVTVVMELRSELNSSPPSLEAENLRLRDTSSPAYKMQKFAYLEANSSKVKNSTMSWDPVNYGTGDSVGSNFYFNKKQQSLELKQAGTYFMYIDLKFICTYSCSPGLLSVHLGNKLTCEVELPADSTPVSRKCWTVSRVEENTRLLAQMTAPKVEQQYWKLDLKSSGFGVFLVD